MKDSELLDAIRKLSRDGMRKRSFIVYMNARGKLIAQETTDTAPIDNVSQVFITAYSAEKAIELCAGNFR